MKFSYNWLKEYLDFNLSPEKLAEILTLHSFETVVLKKLKNDTVLDIDILPNRFSDASSHWGIAREIKALLLILRGEKHSLKNPKTISVGKSKNSLNIEIKDSTLCPRYSAALIKDIKVGPSPKWLKEKLSACGVGSINNIVDITNFVMLELGQPIHAFDYDKINEKIIIRKACEGEEIETLDGKKYILDEEILVIADKDSALALAGIKGGRKAEITAKTKNILLESAYFERRQTYLSAKKLKIESDAARRFSAGFDNQLSLHALFRAAYLLIQETGSKVEDWSDINFCEKKVKKIKLTLANLNQFIGKKILADKIKRTLIALGCQIEQLIQGELKVTIPNFRKDLEISEDLIEEIARMEGYANLLSRLPSLPLAPVNPQAEEICQEKIRNILRGAGFSEVYNYSFISEDWAESLEKNGKNWLYLKKPISERFAILRPNLLGGLLANIKQNLKYNKNIRLFEIGKVFHSANLKTQGNEEITVDNSVLEKNRLCLVLSLANDDSLFELKGMVELVLKGLGINNFWFKEADEENISFNQATLADIKIDEEVVGHLGKINPSLLNLIGLKQSAVGAFLDMDKILHFSRAEYQYQPPSKYPAVLRDLAILVDHKTKFSEILNIIESLNIKFLQDVDLFDIYESGNLSQGKKSLAFHILYQSKDRTLSDNEVNKEHRKIEKALEKRLGAMIR